jgi:hypothetical protein
LVHEIVLQLFIFDLNRKQKTLRLSTLQLLMELKLGSFLQLLNLEQIDLSLDRLQNTFSNCNFSIEFPTKDPKIETLKHMSNNTKAN